VKLVMKMKIALHGKCRPTVKKKNNNKKLFSGLTQLFCDRSDVVTEMYSFVTGEHIQNKK